MIQVRGISKTYGKTTVLGPLDLDIPSGGITALVGPNGAGKSTLLTIIGRLLEPTTGTVTINGMDTRQTKSDRLACTVSVLRQENHFVARLQVRQLVELGRFPHSKGRLTPADREAVASAMDFLQLNDLAERYLDELSGGQRQRAYVAMVLAQDTEYVLLDEPLNNLDIGHGVAMMSQLRQAADEMGKTFVVVIHDINYASAYADRVIGLVDGELCFAGPPREVISEAVLEPTFGAKFHVRRDGDYPLADYYRARD